MPDRKISQLEFNSALTGLEVLPIVQNGLNKKLLVEELVAASGVQSVNGQVGIVTLTASDLNAVEIGSGLSQLVNDVGFIIGNQPITLTGDLSGTGTTSINATIGANKVTDAMLRQSAALSVLGRSVNSAGNVADISAAVENQILRRVGNTVGFGPIDLSSSNAVGSSILAAANGGTGLSALGTANQYLKMNSGGSALEFATLGNFTSVAAGLTPASGGGIVNFLRADGTWTTIPISAGSGLDKSGDVISLNGEITEETLLYWNSGSSYIHIDTAHNVTVGQISMTLAEISSGDYSQFVADKTGVYIYSEAGSGLYSDLFIKSDGNAGSSSTLGFKFQRVGTDPLFKGAYYFANYHSLYTNRSLVDKEYVDNLVAAGGNVYKVGTPVNDQVAIWTGDGTVEGTTGLTYTTDNLTVKRVTYSVAGYMERQGTFGTIMRIAALGTLSITSVSPTSLVSSSTLTLTGTTTNINGSTAINLTSSGGNISLTSSSGNLNLTGANAIILTSSNGALKLTAKAEASVLSPQNGMINYDTTSSKFRMYENGSWKNAIAVDAHIICNQSEASPLTHRNNLVFSGGLTAIDSNPNTVVKIGGILDTGTTLTGTTFYQWVSTMGIGKPTGYASQSSFSIVCEDGINAGVDFIYLYTATQMDTRVGTTTDYLFERKNLSSPTTAQWTISTSSGVTGDYTFSTNNSGFELRMTSFASFKRSVSGGGNVATAIILRGYDPTVSAPVVNTGSSIQFTAVGTVSEYSIGGIQFRLFDGSGGGRGTFSLWTTFDQIPKFSINHLGVLNIADTPSTEATFSTASVLVRAATGDITKVVASGGGTTSFLRADGTWAVPSGTSVSAHIIENSGTPLTQRANLNFTNGLTASDNVTDTDVKLGGPLTANTSIGGDVFTLYLGTNILNLSAQTSFSLDAPTINISGPTSLAIDSSLLLVNQFNNGFVQFGDLATPMHGLDIHTQDDGLGGGGFRVYMGSNQGFEMHQSNSSQSLYFWGDDGALRYGGDYSLNYVDRTLPDWGTVKGAKTFTGMQTFRTGTAAAGTAPVKFVSGVALMTAPEVGAFEFLTDKVYFTITAGAARKEFTLNDTALTSGRIPYTTTNGRLTDNANFVYNGTTFSLTSDDIYITSTGFDLNLTASASIAFNSASLLITSGGGIGVQYAADYSGGYADRSLADWGSIRGAKTFTGTQTLRTGSTTAGTAPLKFVSGSLMTAPEIGAVEFLTDKAYLTITTGAARKEFTLNDSALTSGRIPYTTTNGRLTDSANLLYNGSNFSLNGHFDFYVGNTTALDNIGLYGDDINLISAVGNSSIVVSSTGVVNINADTDVTVNTNGSFKFKNSTVDYFEINVNKAIAFNASFGTEGQVLVSHGNAAPPTWETISGGLGTNLSYTAATRVLASDTGSDATLPLFTSGDAGLAPASGGGTTNFLRADGSWAAPGGGGGITNSAPNTYMMMSDGTNAVQSTSAMFVSGSGALNYTVTDAGTTNVLNALSITRTTSNTPAAGIGMRLITANIETTAGNELAAAIDIISTDVGSGTEDFDLVFYTTNAGSLSEKFRINNNSFTFGNSSLAGDRTISAVGSGVSTDLIMYGTGSAGKVIIGNANYLQIYGGSGAPLNVIAKANEDLFISVSNNYNIGIGSTQTNLGLFESPSGTSAYGAARGVVKIQNASVVPDANPSLGGYLYSEGGALKWRGSSGTITTIANA